MNPFTDTSPTDDPEDWRNKPQSPPRVITPEQYRTLREIILVAKHLWSRLRDLEAEAYEITQELDKTGYTSDLVLQSDVDIDQVLDLLQITVEGRTDSDPHAGDIDASFGKNVGEYLAATKTLFKPGDWVIGTTDRMTEIRVERTRQVKETGTYVDGSQHLTFEDDTSTCHAASLYRLTTAPVTLLQP